MSVRANSGLIYLYCVLGQVPKLKEVQSLMGGLYFVYAQGLYAVAGEVSPAEFGEENLKKNLTDLEWVKQKASLHEKIIEGIMKYACVIPFKFATLFNTEDSLKTMLKKHAVVMKENLSNLRDKQEWGVKLYCDTEKLKCHLSGNDAELLKLEGELKSSSPGKAYILKKKKEGLLDSILTQRLNEASKSSFERLKEKSLQTRVNRLLPKEVTERQEDMILNAAFLVDKNKVGDFKAVLPNLEAEYADRWLVFDCTGPWPAYNFCQMRPELTEPFAPSHCEERS